MVNFDLYDIAIFIRLIGCDFKLFHFARWCWCVHYLFIVRILHLSLSYLKNALLVYITEDVPASSTAPKFFYENNNLCVYSYDRSLHKLFIVLELFDISKHALTM